MTSKNEQVAWLIAVAAAVVAGIYFRFLGIGTWSFAYDEYYIFKATQFVKDTGLPAFSCGGYYARGLLNQYLAAPFLDLGLPPEGVVRTVTVVSSLLLLPAVYLLGARLGGTRLAAVATIVMCLSTWEIEMARFARMYAPFQALFLWYCYHAYRLVENKDWGRWKWLLLFSLLGPLVWEGGISLAVLNILVLMVVREDFRWVRGISAISVLMLGRAFQSINFRHLGSQPQLTDAEAVTSMIRGAVHLKEAPILLLDGSRPAWMAIILSALAIAILIPVLRTWHRQNNTTAAVSLLVVAVLVMANQLLLASLALLGAFLIGWLQREDWRSRGLATVYFLIGLTACFWIAVATYRTLDARSVEPLMTLVAFPEFMRIMIRPWGASMPVVTILVFIGVLLSAYETIFGNSSAKRAIGMLLAGTLVCAVIVGSAPIRYEVTRYSFHLYPVMIILAAYGFHTAAVRLSRRRTVYGAAPFVGLLLVFAASTDFRPVHLWTIDSYETNHRVHYRPRIMLHYYRRYDFRSAAQYVNERLGDKDIVITTEVVTTQYLEKTDYVYLNSNDGRYPGQVCPDGKTERWSNLPLISSQAGLQAVVRSHSDNTVWLVAEPGGGIRGETMEFISEFPGIVERYTTPDGKFMVFSIDANSTKSKTSQFGRLRALQLAL